jgi:hypothetical protein
MERPSCLAKAVEPIPVIITSRIVYPLGEYGTRTPTQVAAGVKASAVNRDAGRRV